MLNARDTGDGSHRACVKPEEKSRQTSVIGLWLSGRRAHAFLTGRGRDIRDRKSRLSPGFFPVSLA